MGPGPESIEQAAARIREGGLVAFPTETVYGLGADAFNERAVRAVYELKGRPATNPLIVHVADQAMARRVASHWSDQAQALAARFWPGPLTVVVPRAAELPAVVTSGGPGVAVRCPDHPVALELIRAVGGPIVGPSANPSGRVSPTNAAHVRESFPDSDLMVLDGGTCRRGIESTVVSLLGPEPVVLRLGAVPVEDLGLDDDATPVSYLPPDALELQHAAPLPAPGRLSAHYAPHTPATLFSAADWPGVLSSAGGGPVIVLTHVPTRGVIDPHEIIRMPAGAEAYAARLYAAVRQADARAPALIAVERPEMIGGLWDAIRDRLERLASRE